MTTSSKKSGQAQLAKPEREYAVGYCKPPVANRFQPKQSGNPSGRPPGSKNKIKDSDLAEIVLSEARRKIKINDGDRSIKVPVARAIVRAIDINAMKGNPHAQRQATDLMAAAERQREKDERELLEAVIDYKMRAQEELERRRRLGITDLPEIIPHPDQIIVDLRSGETYIVGPMTKEEKARAMANYEELRETFRQMVQFVTNRLATLMAALDRESRAPVAGRLSKAIERDIDLIKSMKKKAQERCEEVRPWGFIETRDLWIEPIELKFPWVPKAED